MCGFQFLQFRSIVWHAALLFFLGFGWLFAAQAVGDEIPQRLTKDHYTEALLEPEPIDGDRLDLDPEPYVNNKPWYQLPAGWPREWYWILPESLRWKSGRIVRSFLQNPMPFLRN